LEFQKTPFRTHHQVLDRLQKADPKCKPSLHFKNISAKKAILDLMNSCWEKQPDERPKFEDIEANLKKSCELHDIFGDLSL
jgi:hypothetical protein